MAERLLTLNIRKYLVTQPRTKRARKAVKFVRERVAHYTKIKEENVKIAYTLNNLIFKHYAKSMLPLKLRVKIGTDTADVLPFSEPKKEEPKQQAAGQKQEKKGLFSIGKKEQLPAVEKKEETKPMAQSHKAAPPAKK